MAHVVLIASGPSGEHAVIPDGAKVACVNASFKLIEPRVPDYWMCAEHSAAYAYAKDAKRMYEAGCVTLGRPQSIRRGVHGGIAVPHGWGPRTLRHLHSDVLGPIPRKDDQKGDPTGGKCRPWMTSGVLLLWWLLEEVKPEVLDAYGIMGYPSAYEQAAKGAKEYAPGLVGLESRPKRIDEWVEQSNWWVGCCISAITNYYTDTRINWGVRPRNFGNCGDWRVHWLSLAQREVA